MVILDTNILIELTRGNVLVKSQIATMPADIFYVSAITTVEFMAGARDKSDLKLLEKQLGKYTAIPINDEISNIFVDLCKTYVLSHRPDIPDLLIAATALYYHLPLYTLNKKDFRFIPDLQLI